MYPIALIVLAACGASQPPTADLLRGECDASAVIATDAAWIVATDESTSLAVYAPRGPLLHRIDLTAALESASGGPLERDEGQARELDLEGAARVGDRVWWLGSHGLDKKGRVRPNRRLLFATNLPGPDTTSLAVLGPPRDLLPALQALPELGPSLAAVADRPPKDGGLDIEGLAADPRSGELLVGLRSPVDDGRAWVVAVSLPDGGAAASGTAQDAVVAVRARLDLGGRGIRGLTWSEGLARFVVVAGPPDEGSDFALYTWDGVGAAEPVAVALGDLRPEGIADLGEHLLLVSDDGAVERGGAACKDLRADDAAGPEVYFRYATPPLPRAP